MAQGWIEDEARSNKVILRVLAGVGRPIASTQLVKLVYLVDYTHFQHYGETLTGFEYDWDNFGPNAKGHAIISEANALAADGEQVVGTSEPNIYGGQTNRFRFTPAAQPPQLSNVGEMIVDDIIAQYGRLSVRAITRVSKQTAPFESAKQFSSLHMDFPHSSRKGRGG